MAKKKNDNMTQEWWDLINKWADELDDLSNDYTEEEDPPTEFYGPPDFDFNK